MTKVRSLVALYASASIILTLSLTEAQAASSPWLDAPQSRNTVSTSGYVSLSSMKLAANGHTISYMLSEEGYDERDFATPVSVSLETGNPWKVTAFVAETLPRTHATRPAVLLLVPSAPDDVQNALASEGVSLPWTAFFFQVNGDDASPSVSLSLLGMPGKVAYDIRSQRVIQSSLTSPRLNSTAGCIDCVLGQLQNVLCEALGVTISCATVVACPGSLMHVIVKEVIKNLFSLPSSVCTGIDIVTCAAACVIPTITLSPSSNATVAASEAPIRVNMSSGTTSLGGSWVYAYPTAGNGQKYINWDLTALPHRSYEYTYQNWRPTVGQWTILTGNIPYPTSVFTGMGIPWLKSSRNVTVGDVTYSISGNAGVSGVTVAAGTRSAASNASGDYTIQSLSAGTYTVTPSKSGCTFSPTSRTVTVGPNSTGRNFSASCTGGGGDVQLASGVALTGQSVAAGAWKYYYINVPAGRGSLVISTSSATGDVDIYTRFNSKPSLSAFVCRPYSGSGNETCTQNAPTAGVWWVGVYGYASGGYTIRATY